MYVIWNKKIWSSYNASAGWRAYTGADPHTSHMHISLSWAGAQKKTSYWTGTVAPILKAPNAPSSPVRTAPIEAPAKDLFTPPAGDSHDHSWHDSPRPSPSAPVAGPNRLPVLTAGERALDVAATDDGVTTPFLLQGGRHYLLTATGTYAYGTDPMTADAECSRWPRDSTWHRATQWEGSGGSGGLDLTVNGRATSWSPMVDDGTGCDTATHTYTLMVTPRVDGPLRLALRDNDRSDNSGALHVVLRPLDGAATD
jgi:hypothetical protein